MQPILLFTHVVFLVFFGSQAMEVFLDFLHFIRSINGLDLTFLVSIDLLDLYFYSKHI